MPNPSTAREIFNDGPFDGDDSHDTALNGTGIHRTGFNGTHIGAGSIAPTDLEKSLLQNEKAILQVVDAPLDGTKPQFSRTFNFNDDIQKGMGGLPQHMPENARILDITIHSDFIITGLRETKVGAEKKLIEFLNDEYAQTQPLDERRIFRWINDPLLVNDLGSISSKWSQQFGSGGNYYRLVNRTSLQQDPLDLDVHPRDSYLTCAQDAKGRLIVIIVNDVWSEQDFHIPSPTQTIPFQNPRLLSAVKDGTGWTSFSDGTIDTFAKPLVLDFFLASIYLQPVDFYAPLIYPSENQEAIKYLLAKNPHLQVPLGLFEPRLSAKSMDAFKEIENAEGILRSVNNLVDSIEFVVEAINQGISVSQQQPVRKGPGKFADFETCMQFLEGLYKERRNNPERALNALNRQLDYLTKRHSIREAKSIKILTILASLYLPLSLSASLLGMETPFRAISLVAKL